VSTPEPLAMLQGWLQAQVLEPDPDDDAIARRLTPSRRLDAASRLAIVARSHHARVLECLREQLPAFARLCGPELFEGFARDYLAAHPPRGYSLAALDAGLADHLEATRPDRDRAEPWVDVLVALVRLERCFREAFDGPGLEPGDPPALDVTTLDERELAHLRVCPSPALRRLSLRVPVHGVMLRLRDPAPEPASGFLLPSPRPTELALARVGFVVRIVELAADEAVLFDRLVADDHPPLGPHAAAHPTTRTALAGWLRAGCFMAASLDPSPLHPNRSP
jgi:hypothetical protein